MESGWLPLPRNWRKPELFGYKHSKEAAFLWLIARACWEPTAYRVKGRPITLQHGQLCVSREQLAREWGWPKTNVDRFLKDLELGLEIELETGSGKTVITICNYVGKYGFPDRVGPECGTPSGPEVGPLNNNKTNQQDQEEGNVRERAVGDDLVEGLGGHGARPKPAKPEESKIMFDYLEGRFVGITDALIERWTDTYNLLDVPQSIKQMEAWGYSKQADLRRKKNLHQFIVGWLGREQSKIAGARDIAAMAAKANGGSQRRPDNRSRRPSHDLSNIDYGVIRKL